MATERSLFGKGGWKQLFKAGKKKPPREVLHAAFAKAKAPSAPDDVSTREARVRDFMRKYGFSREKAEERWEAMERRRLAAVRGAARRRKGPPPSRVGL